MDYIAHVPIIVGLVFEKFDPHVWDRHGQTIIKPDTTLADGGTEQRHAGHVLCDGNNRGIECMQNVVRLYSVKKLTGFHGDALTNIR